MVIEQITFWDLLVQPSLTLHLPRFALFLLIALILQTVCDRKKLHTQCSISTAVLLLTTGVGGILMHYYMLTSSFELGDRVPVPGWYYPALLILLVAVTLPAAKGVVTLHKNHFKTYAVIRTALLLFSIYFAVRVIITPTVINRNLIRWEAEAAQGNRTNPEFSKHWKKKPRFSKVWKNGAI
jgi:cytochrome bd-type quinol oxidase subunit 2